MNPIEALEKHLPEKRKTLLYALREHNWKVVEIDDEYADWAYDQKWIIESTRENIGFRLQLWFFYYEGFYDGLNRVVATAADAEEPSAYGGTPAVDFDGRKFEQQMATFMEELQQFRFST